MRAEAKTNLLFSDRTLIDPPKLIDRLRVIPQVLLAADKDDGQAVAKVQDLRDPLLLNVIERIRAVYRKADQDDVRVRVGERAESIVVFLAGCIP